MRNRDFSRIVAIWVKVPEIPEPDQLDSQTGSSRPSRGRVRVRSGQIRAHCTRNARQEANLNKQHKQRTTPTAFYDAAIRHSRFPIRHIIISGTQVPYSACAWAFPTAHGVCVCACECYLVCPFYEAAAIAASTDRYRICFSHLRFAFLFYDPSAFL